MSIDTTFRPLTPLTFVGQTAVQVVPQGSPGIQGMISFRVKNLSTSVQYFTWGSTSSVTSKGAPIANTPSVNTIGMLPSSVEVFELPAYSYFISSLPDAFEIVAGIGQ